MQLEAVVVEFEGADLASSLLGFYRVDVGEAVLLIDGDLQLCQRGTVRWIPEPRPRS